MVVLIPLVFILTMAFWGALIKIQEFYNQANWLLLIIDILVLIITILIVLSALSTINKTIKNVKN